MVDDNGRYLDSWGYPLSRQRKRTYSAWHINEGNVKCTTKNSNNSSYFRQLSTVTNTLFEDRLSLRQLQNNTFKDNSTETVHLGDFGYSSHHVRLTKNQTVHVITDQKNRTNTHRRYNYTDNSRSGSEHAAHVSSLTHLRGLKLAFSSDNMFRNIFAFRSGHLLEADKEPRSERRRTNCCAIQASSDISFPIHYY